MNLLVINQYYAPDIASTGQLAAELCESLASQGFEVHVVTGRPSYSSASPEAPVFELRNGVQVHRVSIWFKGREHLTARIFGYLQFLWGAWWRARLLVKEKSFDVVLTFHNPPFVGWLGAIVASKHHIPFVYVLHDIHPDVLLATGWKLPWLFVKVWEAVHRYILGKATFVIVLGQAMKETLLKKGIIAEKIITIPLWGRPELQPLTWEQALKVRKELGIDEKSLLLLYAGNMGIMHPLDPLLDAAIALKGEPVYFLFIGEGVKRSQLVSRATQEGLTRVAFLPYQPEERFAQIVGAADACFVVLQPGLERLAFPSRAFTFLSAGCPLITFMSPEAELAQLVKQNGCGWNVMTVEELVTLIRKLLSQPDELAWKKTIARQLYTRYFQREKIMEQYAKVIHEAGRKKAIFC
jgi:glycosyltransferase involved in cell wall biosynthesis